MKRISMSSPDITEAEIQAVRHTISTPTLSIGPQISSFEKEAAEYLGIPFASAVSSGTAGLHLGVLAAGVRDGDLVVTTPFSFIASANCILYERAVPVFVDVDPATGCINPAQVEECARDLVEGSSSSRLRWMPPSMRSDHAATGTLKLLLPVHAFGQPADMDPILDTGRRYGLPVLEDACEAIGSQYKGRKAGILGDAGVFAFYPNKQMTTGEGGMIVTSRELWDKLFRSLRNQGRDVFDGHLNHTRLGYNYRLDEMSAAMGLAQIRRIEELIGKRERVARWYTERLQASEFARTPAVCAATTRMSWFVYVVQMKVPVVRDQAINALAERGIPSRPYFTPIHLQPFYVEKFGYRRGDYPVTETLGDTSLALPFSGVMSEAEVDYVCDTLEEVIRTLSVRKSPK